MSRDTKLLIPELQEKVALFCEEMDRAGQRFVITQTLRTQKEQDALYEQGRSKPGKIVTWTRKSKHLEGKAFDIVMLDDNGKVTWNPIAYEKAGEIGEAVGLKWGGNWNGEKDLPHFEI